VFFLELQDPAIPTDLLTHFAGHSASDIRRQASLSYDSRFVAPRVTPCVFERVKKTANSK
jgi:hypothetical protein